MKNFLIVYDEVRNSQALATFKTIEKHESYEKALQTFKEQNERFHFKVVCIIELKHNKVIYL